jgi:hypothetical protein
VPTFENNINSDGVILPSKVSLFSTILFCLLKITLFSVAFLLATKIIIFIFTSFFLPLKLFLYFCQLCYELPKINEPPKFTSSYFWWTEKPLKIIWTSFGGFFPSR